MQVKKIKVLFKSATRRIVKNQFQPLGMKQRKSTKNRSFSELFWLRRSATFGMRDLELPLGGIKMYDYGNP